MKKFLLSLFIICSFVFSSIFISNAMSVSTYSKPSDGVIYAPYVDVVGDSSEPKSKSISNDDLIIFILIGGGIGIGIFMIGCGISSASTRNSKDDCSENRRNL